MFKKILKGIILTALTVLAVGISIIVIVLQDYYTKEIINELKSEAIFIARGIELEGTDFFDGIDLENSHRITLIEPDGTVTYDSVVDVTMLENHLNRQEVKEALNNETGESVRYSTTLSQKTVYYAVRLDNGEVLRISTMKYTIWALLADMSHIFCILIAVATVLSVFLAYRIAESIIRPINEIDLQHPEVEQVYQELSPLTGRIMEQNLLIKEQIEEQKIEHESRDRMRREFTANVSHELKTPLTSISGFAEIIRDGLVKEEDLPRFAGNIYREAQRLIVLVGDIIKLSQLDGKEVAAPKEEINLYESAEAVIAHLLAAAERKNVSITMTGEPIKVMAVEQIVEEMIYNLVDNAIKYNKDGGRVTVSVNQIEDCKVITVSDTGIGIPKKEQERIFERFYRVNKSHSKEIGGTGLGLSIVKHGAMYHNAVITVESEEMMGTKITVSFP
ncbi:MAG TPA: ATP-binding protein [Lachnospiraceae bacterium]|nr:ATP-binding protein [Lachnospiraceae bacterium]